MRLALLPKALTLVLAAAALPWITSCNEFEIVASCADHVKNGTESDIDCGGDACPRCGLGRACQGQGDCFAGDCTKGICTPQPVAVWTQIMPPMAPPRRFKHAMTFDGTTTLLFGGTDAAQRFGDTWLWDGTAWQNMAVPSPPGRAGTALVHDVGLQRTLLFSGLDLAGTPIDDAWSWSGTDWTQLAPAMGPGARGFPAAMYDINGGQVVLFGGYANSAELGDTWTRKGIDWQMIGTPGPPSRSSSGMVYALKAKRGVLFGGAIGDAPPIPDLNDTWTWDGSAWTNASPSVSPSARHGAAMAYDTVRDRVILFGGVHEGGQLGDTWEWDGERWSKPLGDSPSPRQYAAMAFDPGRSRAVLFGGSPDGATFFDETWEYHVVANPCQSGADCDTGHCVDGLCCESASCNGCEACNLPASPGRCTSCGTACGDGGACGP